MIYVQNWIGIGFSDCHKLSYPALVAGFPSSIRNLVTLRGWFFHTCRQAGRWNSMPFVWHIQDVSLPFLVRSSLTVRPSRRDLWTNHRMEVGSKPAVTSSTGVPVSQGFLSFSSQDEYLKWWHGNIKYRAVISEAFCYPELWPYIYICIYIHIQIMDLYIESHIKRWDISRCL